MAKNKVTSEDISDSQSFLDKTGVPGDLFLRGYTSGPNDSPAARETEDLPSDIPIQKKTIRLPNRGPKKKRPIGTEDDVLI